LLQAKMYAGPFNLANPVHQTVGQLSFLFLEARRCIVISSKCLILTVWVWRTDIWHYFSSWS